MKKQNRNMILRCTCVLSSLLKQWKKLLVVMIVSGMLFDVVSTFMYKPSYSSSMQISLTSNNNSYSDLEGAIAYIKTLDYIFNGQAVHEHLKKRLDVKELEMNCYLSSVDNSNVVNVNVVSNSKGNAYHSLKNIVQWYKSNMKKYNFSYTLNILENPVIHEYPLNVNSHTGNFIKGSFVSGFVFILCVCFFSYFKSTVKTPSDIENYVDCRLFAKIPREIKPRGKKFWLKNKKAILITSLKTSFSYKESIKKLRSKLEKSANKHNYKTIMITGTLENEGKSSVTVNLALSLAQKDYKVLVIDGDIRKPSLHKIFHLKTDKSLNHYLNGIKKWESQVEYLEKHNLFVLCANANINQAEKLVQSDKMKELIKEARKEFDFVIIDTSPACFLNEPLILNELVDASLLVVKQHSATIRAINDTINRLIGVKNNLIGIIYNASVIDFMKDNKMYGYRYGYNRYSNRRRS